MKKLGTILVVVIVVLVALLVIKDLIIKQVLVSQIAGITGTKTSVGGFSTDLFKQQVRIKDFRLYQPQGFPEGTLVHLPAIAVDYDLPAIIGGKIRLPLVKIGLKEMTVIKNRDGKLNVDSLAVTKEEKEEKKEKDERAEKSEVPDFQIDKLILNIGEVVYKDYTQGEEPAVKVYSVGIENKTYTNITDPNQLVVLILAGTMKETAIRGAAIYGVATLLGTGFLPVGVASALVGEDAAVAEFDRNFSAVFDTALSVVRQSGEVSESDREKGVIKGNVDGNDVTVKIERPVEGKVKAMVSARKFLMPQKEAAAGVLYKIKEELK